MQFPGPKGDEEARGLGLGAGMRVGGDARGRGCVWAGCVWEGMHVGGGSYTWTGRGHDRSAGTRSAVVFHRSSRGLGTAGPPATCGTPAGSPACLLAQEDLGKPGEG